jgi:YD repeat-containing protein
LPDGEVTQYTYNSMNRLTQETQRQQGQTLFNEYVFWNADGSKSATLDEQAQPNGVAGLVYIETNWWYDADGRLTTEDITTTNGSSSYNDTQFTYDLEGNRLS